MAFDPSVISQIPDNAGNPVGAVEQGYKLADMQNVQQSNKLLLGQQKQQAQDKEEARNILKGQKLDTPQDVTKAAEKLNQAGLHDESVEFMKAMQGLQAGKGELSLQQYKIQAEKANIIGSTTAGLVTEWDQKVQSGVSPTLATALMTPKYSAAIEQLKNSKLPDGSPALSANDMQQIQQHPEFDAQFLRSISERSQQGAAALKVQMDYHKQDTADKAEKVRERQADTAEARAETYQQSVTNRETNRKAGLFDEDDALDIAKQYLAGDKSVLQNMGRGEAGQSNMLMVRRAIRKEAEAEGLSPSDRAARVGEFSAFMAEERARGTREANIQLAASEAGKTMDIAEKASKRVPRGSWVPPNLIMQNFQKWHSDKDLGAFAQSIDSLINGYARAISPTGIPKEAAAKRALELLSTAQSPEYFESVLGIMRSEIEAAKTAPDEVRDRILASFKKSVAPPNKPAGPAAGQTQPPAAGGQTPGGQTPPAAAAAPAAGEDEFTHLFAKKPGT